MPLAEQEREQSRRSSTPMTDPESKDVHDMWYPDPAVNIDPYKYGQERFPNEPIAEHIDFQSRAIASSSDFQSALRTSYQKPSEFHRVPILCTYKTLLDTVFKNLAIASLAIDGEPIHLQSSAFNPAPVRPLGVGRLQFINLPFKFSDRFGLNYYTGKGGRPIFLLEVAISLKNLQSKKIDNVAVITLDVTTLVRETAGAEIRDMSANGISPDKACSPDRISELELKSWVVLTGCDADSTPSTPDKAFSSLHRTSLIDTLTFLIHLHDNLCILEHSPEGKYGPEDYAISHGSPSMRLAPTKFASSHVPSSAPKSRTSSHPKPYCHMPSQFLNSSSKTLYAIRKALHRGELFVVDDVSVAPPPQGTENASSGKEMRMYCVPVWHGAKVKAKKTKRANDWAAFFVDKEVMELWQYSD